VVVVVVAEQQIRQYAGRCRVQVADIEDVRRAGPSFFKGYL
jgi:hypothetical protein